MLSITPNNRPVALRGHVTNSSFKQWVGILLMPKIDRAHENYLTPEIWDETHWREIILALWFFNKVVWFVLVAMLEGIPSNNYIAANTSFCLYLVKRLIVTLRCAVNSTTSSFQHFTWSLSAKFVFWKRLFNHILVTWPATNLLMLKKMMLVRKTKSLLFCLRYDPLIVFRRQNHINFIFIKTMSHDLLV